jgi:hypothetical protein
MGSSSVLRALPEFSLLLSDTVSENSHILFLTLTTDRCTYVLKTVFYTVSLPGKKWKEIFQSVRWIQYKFHTQFYNTRNINSSETVSFFKHFCDLMWFVNL